MKIATETAPNSRVVLNIEVDQETVDRGLHRAYQRLASRLLIPGFRRGKAPRVVVERHVGRAALMQEAVDLLLPDVFRQAVEETGITPLAQPHFDLVQMEPLTLKATVEVEPKADPGDYRALRIPRPPVEISDADVDAAIEEFRRQHAEQAPVERPVQPGDVVTLDLRVTFGERTLTDRSAVEYTMDPDNQDPAPGFAAQLVGLRAGEQHEFDLTVPADHEEATLAGQTIHCAVAISEAKEVQLPPLDDSLARLHGEAATLSDLRAHLAGRLREQREREADERYGEEVVAAAVQRARVEVPESLITKDVNRILERTAADLGSQPLARQQFRHMVGQSGEQLRAHLRPESEKALRTDLVLDAIAAAEDIEASPAEIAAEFERLAQGDEQHDAEIRGLAEQSHAQETIAQALRLRKARQMLIQIASGESATTAPEAMPESAQTTLAAPEAAPEPAETTGDDRE